MLAILPSCFLLALMENGEVLITHRHIQMLVRLGLAQHMSLASELSAWYFGKIAEFQ